MNKYLATDLDGTLFFPKLKTTYVSKENINTLKKFNNNIIIVSGRNQLFIKKVCKFLSIDETYVACNGAVISYKGRQIYTNYINTKIANDIIQYVKKTYPIYKIILFDSNGKIYSLCDDINRAKLQEKHRAKNSPKTAYTTNKNANKINQLLSKDNTIIKLNIYLDDKEKIKLYDFLFSKEYDLSYALCKGSLEITGKNINKGIGLKYLTKYMNLDNNNVYVAGDDKNDLPMFENFNNSFLINHPDNNDLKNKVKYTLDKFKDIEYYLKEE